MGRNWYIFSISLPFFSICVILVVLFLMILGSFNLGLEHMKTFIHKGTMDTLDKLKLEITSKVLICKDETIDLVLSAVLSRGHVLIEDVPGIGKTTLVRALAASIGCTFQRIQFTPDLMPSDVTGFTMVDMATGELRFKKGAIMNQIILADEINRTSPKTQSSLLEAMQEGQITVDSNTYDLPKPFVVLATQNL